VLVASEPPEVVNSFSCGKVTVTIHKSEGTVKNQVSAVLAKLGVRDRTRAVLKAIECGLLGQL